MILITSADYIVDELKVEFGKIPPCFLPIGNLRLFAHQIKLLKSISIDDIYISLPVSYCLNQIDKNYFILNNVKILKVPDNLSLGRSIEYALKTISNSNNKLQILHGDTLITDIPIEEDYISVSEENEQYNWEYDNEIDPKTIWNGLFSFSNKSYFQESLINSEYSFIKAVKMYSEKFRLKRIITTDWSDFGHVLTFYKNRCKITTQRSFNSLNISNGLVKKSSYNEVKILAEIQWFINLPINLKKYAPQLIEYNKIKPIYYTLEYLYLPTLSELFVFGEQNIDFWKNIFNCCFNFLELAKNSKSNYNNELIYNFSKSLIYDKTLSRLSELSESGIWDLNESIILNGEKLPCLKIITDNLLNTAIDNNIINGYLHGDFCFSNILFDIRSNNIKVIDPRGIDSNNIITQDGDLNYDYAKLTHSILGCYDFIIAERYILKKVDIYNYNFSIEIDKRLISIQNEYISLLHEQGLNFKKIFSQMILLFISMIPLHKDNLERQNALILNAFRLYKMYINL